MEQLSSSRSFVPVLSLSFQIPGYTEETWTGVSDGRLFFVSDLVGLNDFCVDGIPCDEIHVGPFSSSGVIHSIIIYILTDLQLKLFKSKVHLFLPAENLFADRQRNNPVCLR